MVFDASTDTRARTEDATNAPRRQVEPELEERALIAMPQLAGTCHRPKRRA
jgi:hypothetical protein